VRGRNWRLVNNGLVVAHAVVIPLLVVVTVGMLLRALPVETVSEIASWENWRTILGLGG
jgi:hypothetical protein